MLRRSLLTTASLSGLSFAAACSDQNLGRFNTPPEATITSPSAGSTAMTGSRLSLRGAASDTDDQAAELSATWFAADAEICAPAAPADDGTSTCELVVPDTLTLEVRLEVTDGEGAAGSTSVLINVIPNATPTVEVTAPASGEVVNEGENLLFSALASDAEDSAVDLWLTWETDIDGVIHEGAPDSSGVAQFFANDLTAGDRALTVTVTDSAGLFSSALGTFTVNALPSAPVVSLTPASPLTEDDLTVSIDVPSVDPDGDAITYTYAWTVGGAASTASASSSLPASATARDEVWGVSVTGNDAYGSSPVATASVVIGNTAPTLTGLTLTPDPAFEDDLLTCTASVLADADGDAAAVSYDWIVNGAALGDNTDTLDGSRFDRGDIVICTATPFDAESDGTNRTSNSVAISNSPPSVASVVITPSDATASSVLSCGYAGFVDADLDIDQSSYEWAVNGSLVGVGSTLSGAFVGGETVTCSVTPFDGTDAGAVVATSLTIGNSAPVLASAALTPTVATESDTLVCTPGTTADDDGTTSFTFTYAWTVNGSAISATTSTLTAISFSVRDDVACWVTPTDGSGAGNATGAAVASNTVEIANSAPVVSSVSLAPTTIRTVDTLSAGVVAADLDGDSITYTYDWYVDGALAESSATSTLSGAVYFDEGQIVYVVVTPYDGESSGSAQTSSSVTVSNSSPTVAAVGITPRAATATSVLTCSYSGFADADSDADVSTYTWTVNGVFVGTASTLTGAFFGGDTVMCMVTPYDGTDIGTAIADSVTIDNTAPDLANVALTPTAASESDTLRCVPGATTDADGTTSFTYAYAWAVNGAAISDTTSSVTGSSFSVRDQVACVVTPNDGSASSTATGAAVASNTVTISNTAPVVSIVTLSPSAVETDDTLTATVTATDLDGDSLTYTYSWYVDGVASGSSTSSTLNGAAYFDKGQVVYVVVTPDDGESTGSAGTSGSVMVRNSVPTAPVAEITPHDATDGDDLTCTVTTASTDADRDSLTYSFGWDVAGTPYTGAADAATTSVVDGVEVAGGETWTCSAMASDGAATSAAGEDSVTVAIGDWQYLSAGYYHTCGVDGSGSVWCWGYDSAGQSTPPSGTFTAVSAGYDHTCGIDGSGDVQCWGNDDYGQATPPSGTFSAISGGVVHQCGIGSSGAVQCWGNDDYGQATPPSGTFTAVSAGAYHACGIGSSGSVRCWGRDTYGEATPASGTFIALSAGWFHTCGIKSSGAVQCWGRDIYGQATPPSGTFIALSSGGHHTCGIESSGALDCWGWDVWGQATPPSGTFTALTAGGLHTCAIDDSSALDCWGYDAYGQSTPP